MPELSIVAFRNGYIEVSSTASKCEIAKLTLL
jgi:hypothetical protein